MILTNKTNVSKSLFMFSFSFSIKLMLIVCLVDGIQKNTKARIL